MHSGTQFNGSPGSMLEQNAVMNKPIGRHTLKMQTKRNKTLTIYAVKNLNRSVYDEDKSRKVYRRTKFIMCCPL